MEWSDQGLVLGVRHHGETSAIAELMTKNHGRYLGLVRGGRSRKMRPVLQAGNLVNATWRARLDEHLGQYQMEPEKLRAATLMADRASLYCIHIMSAHLRLLPERQSQSQLYDAANIILDHAHDAKVAGHLIVRFELALLEELGFGLNISQCVVSGSQDNLLWVSPKSGCAVSREEGAPWATKLLPLPAFLLRHASAASLSDEQQGEMSEKELKSGFELTGHFLNRHVYTPRAVKPPDERGKLLIEAIKSDDI